MESARESATTQLVEKVPGYLIYLRLAKKNMTFHPHVSEKSWV
jgi:hypothetical protein